MLCNVVVELLGKQQFPTYLKTPVPTAVLTFVLYFVLVLICEARIGVQSQFKNGYCVAPPPIENTTGALIVALAGRLWAKIIQ